MANINKIKLSGTTYNIQDSNAALVSDVFITAQNRNSIQSVIKEGVYSLSTDDVYSITGTKENSTDRIKGLIIVDNTSYNFTGSTSSDVEGVSALVGIVTFDLSSNFSISLVDRDTNHINELFIESFTSDGEESPMTNITITHNPSVGVNKIDYVATLYTEFVHEKYALSEELSGKQDTLIAGSGITISGNVISATGGGSGDSGATVIEVTQAQYDALVSAGTLDLTALYIITDATPIDISNYMTSAETESAITAAVSGKVDTSAITSAVTSASTDSEIPTAKAVYDAIPTGGTSITIDPTLDSGSTNPVANSAITTALNTKTDISSVTIYEYGNPSTYSSAFVGGKTAYGFSVSGITTSIIWYFRVSDGSTLSNYGINGSGNFYDYAGEQISIPSFINTELTKYNNGVFDVYFNTNNFYADYFPNTTEFSFTIYESFTLEPLKTKVEENTTALGGLKLVKITAADYAQITPDDNTVYFIGDSNGYTMKIGNVNVN